MADHSFRELRPIAVSAYGPTLLGAVGTGAVLPVVALSARDLGAGIETAALMVSMIGLGQLLADLPAGALTARIGERRALMTASTVEFVGGLGSLLARSVLQLALSVLVIGVAGSVFGLARQSYLTAAVPVGLRARALSTLGGVGRIGLFFGPFVGAATIGRFGVASAYAVDMAASVAAFLLVLLSRDVTAGMTAPEQGEVGGVFAALGRHRAVLATVGVGVLFISVARACRLALVPLWAASIGLGAVHASLVFGIAGAVDMLLFYPGGAVMDRYGRLLVALPSMVLLGLGMIGLIFTHGFASLVLVAVLLGVGNGVGSGLVMTLGADASPAVGRPQFLAGWRLMADSGSAVGPLIISAITVFAPLSAAAVVMGGVAFAGAGWLRVWVPRYDPRSARSLARRHR